MSNDEQASAPEEGPARSQEDLDLLAEFQWSSAVQDHSTIPAWMVDVATGRLSADDLFGPDEDVDRAGPAGTDSGLILDIELYLMTVPLEPAAGSMPEMSRPLPLPASVHVPTGAGARARRRSTSGPRPRRRGVWARLRWLLGGLRPRRRPPVREVARPVRQWTFGAPASGITLRVRQMPDWQPGRLLLELELPRLAQGTLVLRLLDGRTAEVPVTFEDRLPGTWSTVGIQVAHGPDPAELESITWRPVVRGSDDA